jgi:hypothetical protein
MKNKLFSSFLLGIFILLTGCASTSITSFVDPDYRAVQFKNILVAANTNKLGDRLSMENRIVEVLATNGIKAIPSYSIFPPTREFTDSLKTILMLESKIDGCLMVYFGERGIEQVQIPVIGSRTKSESQTTGNITPNFNGIDYNSQTTSESKTTFIGGEIVDKPYAEFEIKLFDVFNGKMVWIANSFTGGSAYSNFNTVYSSFCNNIVNRLSEDNLIRISIDIKNINEKEIARIIKERQDKPDQNKIDVVVLNNGEIITGIILSRHEEYNWSEEYTGMKVTIQDKDKVIHRILIKDIRELYQK